MALKLYNYLTRKIENFKPLNPPSVGLYTCGPTVYDFAHIGNLRTFIFEDVLKRTLEVNGHKVTHVMNITDVDDKIIKGMREKGVGIREFTVPYEKAFFQDLEKLNIKKATHYPRATEHISSMIRFIEVLMKKGFAYKSNDGVYFAISKFKNYGKLSGVKIKGLKIGARVAADEYDKDEPADFTLWKFPPSAPPPPKRLRRPSKASEGQEKTLEPTWDSPWGKGRPGWHIECSAMSTQYLDQPFDIHAAAVDLLFPHNENEIAQSEAAEGKKFVNYWVEGEHLLVEGQKMAKSLGNIIRLLDLEKKALPAGRQGFEPLSFRYLVLTAHYRTQLNFTWQALEAAQNALKNLRNHVSLYQDAGKVDDSKKAIFIDAINDDLDTPKALAILWEVVRSSLPAPTKKRTVLFFDQVLGLGLADIKPAKLPEGAAEMIERREELRRQKNWSEADKLRIKLRKMGVEVEDTDEGPRWRVLSSL